MTRPDHSCLRPRGALCVPRSMNEDQISDIHHRSNGLSRNKHRVHSVNRIRERDQSADETHVPERNGHSALRGSLRSDPLHHPTAEEEPLTQEADTDPDCLSTHEMLGRRTSSSSSKGEGYHQGRVDSRRRPSEFIQEHALLHPTYGDQIVQRFEQAVSHPVLGDAMNAGIMPDGHFGYRESIH